MMQKWKFWHKPYKLIKTPKEAYDLWADSYDQQPDNLMLWYDKKLMGSFLSQAEIRNKTILDFGCGTGRHWGDILDHQPKTLTGADISQHMLGKLTAKFPKVNIFLIEDDNLTLLGNDHYDIIISTLVIAHIKNIQNTIQEWSRLIKKDGEIFITDFHPMALKNGSMRTFAYKNESFAVKNYIHSLEKLEKIFADNGWKIIERREMIVDDSVKHFFDKESAIRQFEKIKGTPFIFSMHLKK